MKDEKNENEIESQIENQSEDGEQNKNEQPKNNTKAYFYAAVAACVLGVVSFGLAFSVLKIYSLIASVIFFLVSLTLINTQKKAYNFKWVKYLSVITYVLLALVVLFFIGGIIFAAVA